MRPFERYKLNVYHVIENFENCVLVEIHKKKRFMGFNCLFLFVIILTLNNLH